MIRIENVAQKEMLTQLADRYRVGVQSAFEQIYQAMYNDMYYYALKNVKNRETAMDVVQTSFMVVFESTGALKDIHN